MDTPHKKILLAAGGTGGHLFPAKKLAKQLIAKGHSVCFAGAHLAKNPFFLQKCFIAKEITSFPISFRHPLQMAKAWIQGFFQSKKWIEEYKPDLVVGFGSYHTFPILLAAKWKKIPLFLFSADVKKGKVQKMFSHLAAGVFSPFEEGKKIIRVHPMSLTSHTMKWEKKEARKKLMLAPDCFTILIFGGSQGCMLFNQIFPKLLQRIFCEKFQVIHLTGTKEDVVKKNYQENKIQAYVTNFSLEMSLFFSAADFAIVRAGAATLSELLYFCMPALMIPYPFAYGHQVHNARFFSDIVKGGAFLEEKNISEAILEKMVISFSQKETLRKFQENIQKYQENGKELELGDKILAILQEKK